MRCPALNSVEDLVEWVRAPLVGSGTLAIWGGACAEHKVRELFEGWLAEVDMPFRIWEHADRILFSKGSMLSDCVLLERARTFGASGDLNAVRQGHVFRWWFVGEAGLRPPAALVATSSDFWDANPTVTFHVYRERALLWGKRSSASGRWYEGRVAAASLEYPVPDTWARVQVVYDALSRGGHVRFVRFVDLEEWEG